MKKGLDVLKTQMPSQLKASSGPPEQRAKPKQKDPAILAEQMHKCLDEFYGFDGFRGHQEEAILGVLQGKDVFVLMPTGGGKSLCYSLPALVLKKQLVIVVSPLIALMQDQVSALRKRGVAAAFLSSTLTKAEEDQILTCLGDELKMKHMPGHNTQATLQLLFATPERLATKEFRTLLSQLHKKHQLGFVAVDEAHCVSSWGHDFRPSYRKLAALRETLPGLPCMALTATASKKVREDVMQQLNLTNPLVLLDSFNRSNITYSVALLDVLTTQALATQRVLDEVQGVRDCNHVMDDMAVTVQAINQLGVLLAKHVRGGGGVGVRGCAIVYVHRRIDANEVVGQVQRVPGGKGLRCAAYHAGMADKDRKWVMDRWMEGKLDLVAATVAFGMGIDRADVRLVVHWCVPQSLEGYYQESGRAGRDGQKAHAALFYRESDRSRIEWILENEAQKKAIKGQSTAFPAPPTGQSVPKPKPVGNLPPSTAQLAFRRVVSYATTATCRRATLLQHFDEALAPGTCQGCDYCEDVQGVIDMVAKLSSTRAAAFKGAPAGLTVAQKASNQWKVGKPEDQYGADQHDDDDDDDDGREGSDEDTWRGGGRKRIRDDEDDDDHIPHEDPGFKLARAAAEATKARYGKPLAGADSDYLTHMAALEEELGAKQGQGSDFLDILSSRPAKKLAVPHVSKASDITDANRNQKLQALQKNLTSSPAVIGLPSSVTDVLLHILVSELNKATSATQLKTLCMQLLQRCKTSVSLFQLIKIEQLPDPASGPSLTLQDLLTCEVEAIKRLVESHTAGKGVGGGVTSKPDQLMKRVAQLGLSVAGCKVPSGVLVEVKELSECTLVAMADAAQEVLRKWTKQSSASRVD